MDGTKRERRRKSLGVEQVHSSKSTALTKSTALNFQPGSWVSIRRNTGQYYTGEVMESTKTTLVPDSIVLRNVKIEGRNSLDGHLIFYQDDIANVSLAPGYPKPHDPNEYIYFPNEIRMDTVVIASSTDLEILIGSLNSVIEIGCHISGAAGRFDQAKYVMMNIKNVIVVIDISKFEGENARLLWKKLGKEIFSNSKIVKVFFESCPVGDYLYHQHTIKLVNVFDLKATYEYLLDQHQIKVSCRCHCQHERPVELGSIKSLDIVTLWSCFLPDQVPFFEYVVMETKKQATEVVEDEKMVKKHLVLQVKYLLMLKEAMKYQMFGHVELLAHLQNRKLNEASDVEARLLLEGVHG